MIPRSSIELLSLGHGLFLNKKGKILWKVAITTTLWVVWLERNKRIFEDVEENIETVWDRIRLWVAYG